MVERRTPTYRTAGLEPLGNSSRRWRDTHTGETLSYNAGRRRIQALSAGHRSAVQRFESELAKVGESPGALERARRAAGLSQRGLNAYRTEFVNINRTSASPFVKEGRRWTFRGARGFEYTFIDLRGVKVSALFSGGSLIAMQDYWDACVSESQAEMDEWLKEYPAGVIDDSGMVYFPETDLRRLNSTIARMSSAQRARYQREFYTYPTDERMAA